MKSSESTAGAVTNHLQQLEQICHGAKDVTKALNTSVVRSTPLIEVVGTEGLSEKPSDAENQEEQGTPAQGTQTTSDGSEQRRKKVLEFDETGAAGKEFLQIVQPGGEGAQADAADGKPVEKPKFCLESIGLVRESAWADVKDFLAADHDPLAPLARLVEKSTKKSLESGEIVEIQPVWNTDSKLLGAVSGLGGKTDKITVVDQDEAKTKEATTESSTEEDSDEDSAKEESDTDDSDAESDLGHVEMEVGLGVFDVNGEASHLTGVTEVVVDDRTQMDEEGVVVPKRAAEC